MLDLRLSQTLVLVLRNANLRVGSALVVRRRVLPDEPDPAQAHEGDDEADARGAEAGPACCAEAGEERGGVGERDVWVGLDVFFGDGLGDAGGDGEADGGPELSEQAISTTKSCG